MTTPDPLVVDFSGAQPQPQPKPVVFSKRLPLVEGVLYLDNSLMEVITTCPRAAEYRHLYNRIYNGERPPLNFGGAMHAALAARYTKDPNLFDAGTMSEMVQVLTDWFMKKPNPAGDHRTLDLATKMVQCYNSTYMIEPWSVAVLPNGKPFCEESFALSLGEIEGVPVVYTGRIDLVVSPTQGEIFTLDHKTTSMFGDSFWEDQAVSPQHRGYCWALKRATGLLPKGYIINALRTRKPLVRDESGAVVSKRAKRTEDVSKEDFQRTTFYITEEELDEWEFNIRSLIANYIRLVRSEYLPMHRKWCVHKYGKCTYYDVCRLPSAVRRTYLASEIFTDSEWSPLNPIPA